MKHVKLCMRLRVVYECVRAVDSDLNAVSASKFESTGMWNCWEAVNGGTKVTGVRSGGAESTFDAFVPKTESGHSG